MSFGKGGAEGLDDIEGLAGFTEFDASSILKEAGWAWHLDLETADLSTLVGSGFSIHSGASTHSVISTGFGASIAGFKAAVDLAPSTLLVSVTLE
ncbi:hypothetical protein OGATHE_003198 [Ogataea polymorpha]|uniref:Uncharacterized protein n=1 Tax=Ogataea polymorpha TaxID=460523 RepID=A0A9P8P9W2_9ASCO|nr:hypothetical protein OGATHE_003198 [Ogataea polymorpha]